MGGQWQMFPKCSRRGREGENRILMKEGGIPMLMGEYIHTIDAKGRLIIPSKIREKLEGGFVLTKGIDGCLDIYPYHEWELFEQKLKALPLNDKDARSFVRFFAASAVACELDKQGRVLVPATLREFAGLKKDVVFAGYLTKIEIWSKEKWLENGNCDDISVAAENLGKKGITI